MKIIKKNVYYCDHCKKRSLRSLLKHESTCTANPHRHCGMCEGNDISVIAEGLRNRFTITPYESGFDGDIMTGLPWEHPENCVWTDKPVTLQEIRDKVGNCPACILAVLRQTKLHYSVCKLEPFDFKAEMEAAIKIRNLDSSQKYNCNEYL